MKKKILITILIISGLSINISAQKNTNSPYTRFGYGELVDAGFGRSKGIGGVAFGLRSKSMINPANPAAFSCIDSTSFLFEFGVSGLLSNFATKNASTSKFTGNLDYFALQFPVTKWLGMSAGILPYSFAGYNFALKDSTLMPSTNDSVYIRRNKSFSGNGSISQIYLGLSVDLFKRLSLGVNGYYMFGTINHLRVFNGSASDNRPFYAGVYNSELKVNSFNVRFGLQYHQPLRQKKDLLVIGAIYEFQTKLGSTFTSTLITTDTISNAIKSDTANIFQLPNVYGIGITYSYDNRLLIGADFQFQQFSKTKFYNNNPLDYYYKLNDRMKISVGAEYIHKPTSNKYIDRMSWRLGANYTNSYINVNGRGTQNFAITAGVGFPFPRSNSVVNLNIEYGKIGSTANEMILEQYVRFGVNLTLNENWFFKSRVR